jgi:hypothetical protein
MNLPSHQLTMTVLMTPDKTNFFGNVHGEECSANPSSSKAFTGFGSYFSEIALKQSHKATSP